MLSLQNIVIFNSQEVINRIRCRCSLAIWLYDSLSVPPRDIEQARCDVSSVVLGGLYCCCCETICINDLVHAVTAVSLTNGQSPYVFVYRLLYSSGDGTPHLTTVLYRRTPSLWLMTMSSLNCFLHVANCLHSL